MPLTHHWVPNHPKTTPFSSHVHLHIIGHHATPVEQKTFDAGKKGFFGSFCPNWRWLSISIEKLWVWNIVKLIIKMNAQGSIKIYKLPLPRDLDDHTIMGLDPQGGFFQVDESVSLFLCVKTNRLTSGFLYIFAGLYFFWKKKFLSVLKKACCRVFPATSQSECLCGPTWWRPTTSTPWTSTGRPTPTSSFTLDPRGFRTRRTMSPSNSTPCLESEFLSSRY